MKPWPHLIRWWKWRRYMRRVGAVEVALSHIQVASETRLTTYGIAALAVDAACYGGKRMREIVGIEWDTLASKRSSDEWWHDYEEEVLG